LLSATVGTVLAVHALHGQLPAMIGGDTTPPPESAAPCTLTFPALWFAFTQVTVNLCPAEAAR
jgi:hypothetical protein